MIFMIKCDPKSIAAQRKIHRNVTLRRIRALDHSPPNHSKTRKHNHSFNDFNSEIISSWVDQQTDVTGVSTGWKGLDDLYRVGFVRRRGLAQMRRSYHRACFSLIQCDASFRHKLTISASIKRRKRRTPQVVPGELAIVTGVPNSGKSEFIDALLTNLTENEGWSFAMCSMEKRVRRIKEWKESLRRFVRLCRSGSPKTPFTSCLFILRRRATMRDSC